LTQSQADRCLRILDLDNVTNFEARMVAEVKLYWVVYEKCCGLQVSVADTKAALKAWQEDWAALFGKIIESPLRPILTVRQMSPGLSSSRWASTSLTCSLIVNH